MSRGSGGSDAVAGASPASWVIGLIVALCAVLLLKWLALVALVVVGIVAFVRWARGGEDRGGVSRPTSVAAPHDGPGPAVDPAADPDPDDCSWCGHRGGHRDGRGRLVRPRHVHALPRT